MFNGKIIMLLYSTGLRTGMIICLSNGLTEALFQVFSDKSAGTKRDNKIGESATTNETNRALVLSRCLWSTLRDL